MHDEYAALVRRLAESRDDEIISNSSIEHAAVLIGEMFKFGSGQAQILSGALSPALYTRPSIAGSIGSFLVNGGNLKVLIQDPKDGEQNVKSFVTEISKFIGASFLSNLQVKTADNSGANTEFHFATVGDSFFRFEPDKNKHEAFASFGRKDTVSKINAIFDGLWANGKEVPIK